MFESLYTMSETQIFVSAVFFSSYSTYDCVLRLVSRLLKVQVVVDGVLLIGVKTNLHVEFTPTFFLDAEGWVFECCFPVYKFLSAFSS